MTVCVIEHSTVKALGVPLDRTVWEIGIPDWWRSGEVVGSGVPPREVLEIGVGEDEAGVDGGEKGRGDGVCGERAPGFFEGADGGAVGGAADGESGVRGHCSVFRGLINSEDNEEVVGLCADSGIERRY